MKSREDRAIASRARPMTESLRRDIAESSVTGLTMGHRKDGPSMSVHARFTVNVGGEKLSFQLHVMKDGVWAPGSFPSILNLSKIKSVEKIVDDVVSVALRYSGLTPARQDDEGKTPDDKVREYLKLVLHKDLAAAESRLRLEAAAILAEPSSMHEAVKCWEDAIRRIVHKAMSGMDSIPPELLHRLVDELYAKDIHDS